MVSGKEKPTLTDERYSVGERHLSGTVNWQGEVPSDRGQIVVVDNQIVQPEQAETLLAIAKAPDCSAASCLARTPRRSHR